MTVERFADNPLITPADVPATREDVEVYSTINPGAVRVGSEALLLLRVGERVTNERRSINIAAGMDPSHDRLPARLIQDSIPVGPDQDAVVTEEVLGRMLVEYYEARSWTDTGEPTPEKLDELDIE